MKYIKILFAVAFVFTLCTAFTIGKGPKSVYVFGVSASFTDTLIYYTEIQAIDSVALDKNGFLPKRDLYSYQLKNYLELEKGVPNRTCMIYFSGNKSKLSKEAAKIINKYKKSKSIVIQKIDTGDFKFSKPEE